MPCRHCSYVDESAAKGPQSSSEIWLTCSLTEAVGEPSSGPKKDLVARLLLPPMPQVLVDRRRSKRYVPRDRSCPHALLCALEAAERSGAAPLSKDAWMARAEATKVATTSLYDKSGPLAYDGWASCNGQLCSGQPALVAKARGLRYELGVLDCPGVASGRDVAVALHAKAHARRAGKG